MKPRITATQAALFVFALVAGLTACDLVMIDDAHLGQATDTTAPELTIVSPTEGFVCPNIIEITGTVSDLANNGNSGRVASLSWEVPGTSARAASTPIDADGSFVIQLETVGLGSTFLVSFAATDWNGNIVTRTLSLIKNQNNSLPSFSVIPRNKSVDLSWENVPNTEGYVLYYSTDGSLPSGNNGTQVELDNDTTSYQLEGLVNGNAHFFRLEALPAEGWTGSLSDFIKTIPLSVRTLLPQAKGGFDRIHLSWNGIASTDSFEIWRRKGETGDFYPFSQVSGTSFVDRSVEPGQWYYYCVKPQDGSPILSEPAGATTIPLLQSPQIEGVLSTSAPVSDLVVDGDWLYVSDVMWYNPGRGSLSVYNIADPARPVLAKKIPLDAQDIVIEGNRAYVTVFAATMPVEIGRLHVFDISNPAEITELDSIPLEDVNGDGSVQPMSLAVSNGIAYVPTGSGSDGDGIQIYQISAEGTPTFHQSVSMPLFNDYTAVATCFAIQGGYAYIGGMAAGLYTMDLATRTSVLTNTWDLDEGDFPLSIKTDSSFIYLAGGEGGLLIYSIANPAQPVFIQRVQTPGQAGGVYVQGSTAYISDNKEGLQMANLWPLHNGTPLYELTNPASSVDKCTLLSRMWTGLPASAGNLVVSGSWAYVSAYYAGIQIIRLDNPSQAELRETLPVGEEEESWNHIGDAVQHGQRIYFSQDNILYVLNTEDPEDPRLTATLTGFTAYRMIKAGNLL
ncbi:MAG: hypothetical protein ABIJ86_12970, partial [Spirochaetota bacterium]